jgi:hypothetical protein
LIGYFTNVKVRLTANEENRRFLEMKMTSNGRHLKILKVEYL